jgi:hypothetical protein
MSEVALIGADAEASGHPTECEEPALGEVSSTSSTGISITVGGQSAELASIDSADISFDSHAHDYTSEDGCHELSSHSLDPDSGEPSITINGSPIYVISGGVTADPITGGDVDITSNPINAGITVT